MREIIDFRGATENLLQVTKQYEKNNMNAIDTLSLLAPLKLTIFLYFEQPDEIINNRDDKLFIERLKAANKGQTFVIIGTGGDHNSYHEKLWRSYHTYLAKTESALST